MQNEKKKDHENVEYLNRYRYNYRVTERKRERERGGGETVGSC